MSDTTMTLTDDSEISIESHLRMIDAKCDFHELQYRQLVFDIVEGRAMEADLAAIPIARTLDVLQRDVSIYRNRLQASKDLEAAAMLVGQIDQASREHEKSIQDAAEFEKEIERYREQQRADTEALRDKLEKLKSRKLQLEGPAKEVLRVTFDPTIEEEARPYGRRRVELDQEMVDVKNQINRYRANTEQSRNDHVILNQHRHVTYEEAAKIFPDNTPERLSNRCVAIRLQIEQIEKLGRGIQAAKLDPKRLRWTAKG